VLQNGNGIGIASVRRAVIEGNEIALQQSGRDRRRGRPVQLRKTGKEDLLSDDVTIRRNYIHHHILWRHPDNVQLYRGVHNFKLVDNLLLCGGQGVMTEEVEGGRMEGNVVVSSAANLVLFGHKNSDGWTLLHNTLGMPGIFLLSLSGKNYDAQENIFFSTPGPNGTAATRYADAAPDTYTATATCSGGSGTTWRAGTGRMPDPFRRTPSSPTCPKRRLVSGISPPTRSTLSTCPTPLASRRATTLEVNWDGVPRKIASVEGPKPRSPQRSPAPSLHVHPAGVLGKKTDIALNTRPAPDSPPETRRKRRRLLPGLWRLTRKATSKVPDTAPSPPFRPMCARESWTRQHGSPARDPLK